MGLMAGIYYCLVGLFALPVIVIFVQVLIASLPFKKRPERFSFSEQYRITVLIPAHNESRNILPTLDALREQNLKEFQILVVADNCQDDTAQVVMDYGLPVIERNNLELRGKGYALDHGIRQLAQTTPPDYVVVVDADCILAPDALQLMIRQAEISQRPIQAKYLMYNQGQVSVKMKIAEFAWLLKNYVRPLGFFKLGLPCQLTGSGMTFPWAVITRINFATGHIVEDMKLGLDCAASGAAPLFCPSAMVYSYFPQNEEGIRTQRTRWEHGHLGIIVRDVPRVLLQGIAQRNLDLFAMGVDLIVPPLSLMAMLLLAMLAVGGFLSLFSPAFITPWGLAICLFGLFASTILLFWARYARAVISAKELLRIPFYMMLKLPVYVKFIVQRQSEWVRSKRD